jgi:hypothetical protein
LEKWKGEGGRGGIFSGIWREIIRAGGVANKKGGKEEGR